MFLGATPIPPFPKGTAKSVEKDVTNRCVVGEVTPGLHIEVFGGGPRFSRMECRKMFVFNYMNCSIRTAVYPETFITAVM